MDINEFIEKEREEISGFIKPQYLLADETEIHFSPSGKYKLVLDNYADSGLLENGVDYRHDYMNVKIFRNDYLIHSLNGTTNFSFAWIEKN